MLCGLFFLSLYCYQPTLQCVEASAYTLSVEETDSTPNIGAAGDISGRDDVIASRDLPLYTIVFIDGKRYEVLDRMNIRYKGTGNIDILMKTKKEAKEFGRRKINILIENKFNN